MSDKNSPLVLGGTPRVNLLPVEVKEKVRARASRRRLGVFVVLAVIVAVVAIGVSFVYAGAAQVQLDQAQQRTSLIQQEISKYSSVKVVAAQVADIEAAQKTLTADEISWKVLDTNIRGVLPANVTMTTGTYTLVGATTAAGVTPSTPPPGAIATAQLVLQGPSLVSLAVAVQKLQGVPGYMTAEFNAVTSASGEYTSTVLLTVGSGALYNRFTSPTPTPTTGANQ